MYTLVEVTNYDNLRKIFSSNEFIGKLFFKKKIYNILVSKNIVKLSNITRNFFIKKISKFSQGSRYLLLCLDFFKNKVDYQMIETIKNAKLEKVKENKLLLSFKIEKNIISKIQNSFIFLNKYDEYVNTENDSFSEKNSDFLSNTTFKENNESINFSEETFDEFSNCSSVSTIEYNIFPQPLSNILNINPNFTLKKKVVLLLFFKYKDALFNSSNINKFPCFFKSTYEFNVWINHIKNQIGKININVSQNKIQFSKSLYLHNSIVLKVFISDNFQNLISLHSDQRLRIFKILINIEKKTITIKKQLEFHFERGFKLHTLYSENFEKVVLFKNEFVMNELFQIKEFTHLSILDIKILKIHDFFFEKKN